jgi:hypothetical protein
MKQAAKIIKMLNFWVDPCSEDSPVLERFNRSIKNPTRPAIMTAMIIVEIKNI